MNTMWKPEWSVGSKILDLQHREFLKLVNRASDIAHQSSPESDDTYHDILNGVAEYARLHFQTEEKLLRLLNYVDLETHVLSHEAFSDHLTDILFSATKDNLDKLNLSQFLTEWWVDHILREDMQYKQVLMNGK